MAEGTPEGKVVRIHKVRKQGLGDVIHQGVKGGQFLCNRTRLTSVVRVRRLRVQAQVEEIRKSQRQGQASQSPEQERRPERAGDENEEVRDLHGKFRCGHALNCGHGGQKTQRNQLAEQADQFQEYDDGLN